MACYRPHHVWQLEDNSISFQEPRRNILRELELPCGRCIGCRLQRQREWAIRCVHEAQMHPVNSFITLTYEGAVSPSLRYSDFQRFMYRVRRRLGPTRFFMSGEYGSLNQRPHFHALLFGRTFPDGRPIGKNICESALLNKLWGHGFASFGSVTYQSASYVAKYACKKITGPSAARYYARVDTASGEIIQAVPEFARMSLKPGIGTTWWRKYWRETAIPRDGIVLPGGFKLPTPRYYDKLLESNNPDIYENLQYQRYLNSLTFNQHTTPQRLLSREIYAQSKFKHHSRDSL